MQKQNKGFTIIELIVVIAIIAILAAIVMINVTKYIKSAKDVALEADMHNITLGESSSFAENESYQDCGEFMSSDWANNAPNFACMDDSSGFDYGCSSGYMSTIQLSNGNYWCVDSTGAAMEIRRGMNVPSWGCTCVATNNF